MKNIFHVLKAEHDKHRTLIDLIEKTEGASDGRKELFPRLVCELRSHANAEERTLYAAMMGEDQSQPKASHSVHEHHELDTLMAELLETDLSSSGWISTFKKLAHEARHHMEEEENDTFPAGEKVISESEAESLGAEFHDEKQKEMKEQRVDV